MGDVNSIVGEKSADKLVGPFGHGRKNERGKMLIDFWKQQQHGLLVMNMWLKKLNTKLNTWKIPGDRKSYQIDCILVKQCFRNGTRDVKTLPGADIDTDHNLLVAEVQSCSEQLQRHT